MAITALPTPPSRQDPTNFAIRADAFLAALPAFATEANALVSELSSYSTGAATSASTATSAASSASTSATNAAASASNAAASSTSAAASATSATASATDVASRVISFDGKYLGASSTAPVTQSNGSSLVTGSLYWNTNLNNLYIWTGSSWQAAAASITGAVLSVNGRQGAITISRQDIELVLPVSSTSIANTAVLRDASGNFAGNIISAVDFNSTSDKRLKENINPLNINTGFYKLNPVEFTWKNTGKQSYGLIAQEVEQVFPELVVEREDGTKGVNYIPIIAMLLAKVQELSKKLDALSST